MIDEEMTVRMFGYTSDMLSKNSWINKFMMCLKYQIPFEEEWYKTNTANVYVTCDRCSNPDIITYISYSEGYYLCKECKKEEYKKEYESGLSMNEIAKIHRVTQTTIRNILNHTKDFNIRNKELQSKKLSASQQGIPLSEWDDFTNKDWRTWNNVIYLNKPFSGCHRHHLTQSLIACIPKELHGHIPHVLKSGKGMAEMNMLALQFVDKEIE